MPRAETDKPIHMLHYVDLVELQETQGTYILPPTQLLGYLDESKDSTSALFNLTGSNSKFHDNVV